MTQHYWGSKQILAWEQEQDGQPGYVVKYENGHTSWSPKEVFEATYLPVGHLDGLAPWVRRLACEYVEMRERHEKRKAFIQSEEFQTLSAVDQAELRVEETLTGNLVECLRTRLQHAPNVPARIGGELILDVVNPELVANFDEGLHDASLQLLARTHPEAG